MLWHRDRNVGAAVVTLFSVLAIFSSSCSTSTRPGAPSGPAPVARSQGESPADVASRAPRFSDERAPVRINGKYGYIDRSGAVVIPAIYEDAQPFAEDVAAVFVSGRWSYIDTRGRVKFSVSYPYVYPFSEGRARVRTNSYDWGYIDLWGAEVIPLKYDFAEDFREGSAAVGESSAFFFIDRFGKEQFPGKRYFEAFGFSGGFARVRLVNGGYGVTFINHDGVEIGESGKNILCDAGDFVSTSRGLLAPAAVPGWLGCLHINNWCFVDETGEERFCRGCFGGAYRQTYNFSEDRAVVLEPNDDVSVRDYGVVNARGKRIHAADLEDVRPYSEGLSAARTDGSWGYLNLAGKWQIAPRYLGANPFSGGLAYVTLTNGKNAYIDWMGNPVWTEP